MSDETWVVTLPKLGESVTEGVIGSVFKQVGDEVEFDDPLFEVSTDKVDSEVPSPYDGVVLEVLAQPGDTVPVGGPVLKIGGKGATVENRLPSAAHGVAAAGGRSLSDASTPSMGGSEGPTTEDAHFAPTGAGEVFEVTMPKLGESVTEGTIGTLVEGSRRRCRIRRSAVRRVDRQGGFGDSEPLRRDAAGHPGRRRGDGAGGYRAGTHRGGGLRGGRVGRQRQWSGPSRESACRQSGRPSRHRLPAMPPADGCCRHWCAGSPPSTAST